MRNLSEIRTEIDSIDEQIIELFKKRMDCAKEVGNYKKANNIPVLNQARENEILDAIEERGGEYGSYARLLYSNIMELSRALQHNIVGSGADIKEASCCRSSGHNVRNSADPYVPERASHQPGREESPDLSGTERYVLCPELL